MILLFGNNIVDRFSGPKLTLDTIKFENESNDKLKEYLKNNNSELLSNISNCTRVITIKNDGAMPSNNLNIDIDVDGKICDYKLDSTEVAKCTISDKRMVLNLQRLSKNAELKVIVWMLDEKNEFKVNYADDKNSKTMEIDNSTSYKLSSVTILGLIIICISFGVLCKEMFANIYVKLENRNNERFEKLISTLINNTRERDTDTDTGECESRKTDDDGSFEKAKEKLIEMIKESQKV